MVRAEPGKRHACCKALPEILPPIVNGRYRSLPVAGLAERPDAQNHYTEKLVLAPDVAWEYWEPRNDGAGNSIAGGNWGRFERGNLDFMPAALDGTKNWYFCSQAGFKYNVRFDYILKKILDADPDGQVILIKSSEQYQYLHTALRKRMVTRKLDLTRVVFVKRLAHHRLMAMYNLSDVVLDSYMFGGDTTTREALEVGAPIVTLPGKHLGERWTQAYYKLLGITDLIATDEDDYVRLAVRVARDKAFAASISQRILESSHKLYRNKKAGGVWTDMLLSIAKKEGTPHENAPSPKDEL